MDSQTEKPIVVVTGIAGAIGTALARALEPDYTVVGLDLDCGGAAVDCIEIDLGSGDSVDVALRKFRERYGSRIASVVHLAAYFDFTGEDHPLYEKVNAKVARPLRFLTMALGVALMITPFAYGAGWPATVASLLCGVALIGLSVRRGPIRNRYGAWSQLLV